MPDRIRNDGRQSWQNLHSIDPVGRMLQAEGKMFWGIEPLSENQSTQASPGAVGLLNFPRRIAVRQAMQFGSPQYNHVLRGAWTDRSPLIDAPSAAVVLHSGTAA